MIKEIKDLSALDMVAGGTSVRTITRVVNGVETTTTTVSSCNSSDSAGSGSSALNAFRARSAARRAAREAQREAAGFEAPAGNSEPNDTNVSTSTGSSRRGFPASAALGLP